MLFFGVVGALIFRAVFIVAGASLLAHFDWLAYLFGAFLAFTGLKLLTRTHQLHPESNPLFRMLRKVIPVTNAESDQVFIRRDSQVFATPLFLALVLIELSGIIFAVDSIPAIFATSDPFIVLTSNIFAMLGLRAMYSLLADFLVRLKYLRVGLALVLVFVGTKMLVASAYKIPILVSLGVVAALLGGSAIASLVRPTVVQRPSSNS